MAHLKTFVGNFVGPFVESGRGWVRPKAGPTK